MKTHFETEICSRCHGSGEYSQCQEYGTRCFKCAGNKVVLTKRGAVAKAYLEESCTVPAERLQIGDKVSVMGMTMGGRSFGYIATVTCVNLNAHDPCIATNFVGPRNRYVEVTTTHPKYGEMRHGVYNTGFRVYGTDNEAKIARAIEYQATLTKQGAVRKSK